MAKHPFVRPTSATPDIGLDFFHRRCTEQDGCLIWKMRMKNGPLTRIDGHDWKVRHLMWNLVHPRGIGTGRAPMPTVCGNDLCIHPDHLTLVRRNRHATGAGTKTLLHRARMAQSKRANAKIDMRQALEIRASSDILAVIAKRHGISISTAHRIKAGMTWIDYNNPFAQLIEARHAKAPTGEAVDT